MSPALAGGFLITGPLGKSFSFNLNSVRKMLSYYHPCLISGGMRLGVEGIDISSHDKFSLGTYSGPVPDASEPSRKQGHCFPGLTS